MHSSDLIKKEIDLSGGNTLLKGSIYIIPLMEQLKLPEHLSAKANPRSTTGRLDIFTRLVTDYAEKFDRVLPKYEGPLYVEVVPRSFSIRAKEGERLNQLRFAYKKPASIADDTLRQQLKRKHITKAKYEFEGGLQLRIDLQGNADSDIVGYRAKADAPEIELSKIHAYDTESFWEPIYKCDRLHLEPGSFYILSSRENVRVPADLAAEMIPIDPRNGEFRVHYAGFFDPGFGLGNDTAAVLEVRSHETYFMLEDGQHVARLIYERLIERSNKLYGQQIGSSYHSQKVMLSKQFKPNSV